MFNPKPQLLRAVDKPENVSSQEIAKAQPVYIDGLPEGDSGAVTWASVTGKPTTFPPVIGTSASTAKAGNYVPAWADVSGKPTTFTPATHTHTVANVTGLQAIIDDLEQRVAALESAAG